MKVNDIAVLVAEDLDFDVFGALDVALQEDSVVTKSVEGFFLGFLQAGLEFGGFFDDAHAATTTTEGRFDDEGEADFVGDGEGLVGIRDGVIGAWEDRDLGGDGLGTGRGFVAHRAEKVGGGSDKSDPFVGAGAGKVGIFREKAVTRVDESDAFGFG